MNRFIELMAKDDALSIKQLKQYFRILSKQVHPDISDHPSESFILLKKEYEEAYAAIINEQFSKYEKLSADKARIELLKHLYHFYLCIYTKRSFHILNEMIRLAKMYDEKIEALLCHYRDDMYIHLDTWKGNNKIFYAHNIVITSIMQFFECYNKKGKVPHNLAVNVFLGYRQAIEMWIGKSNTKYKDILIGLHDWMKDEINKPGFEYYGI